MSVAQEIDQQLELQQNQVIPMYESIDKIREYAGGSGNEQDNDPKAPYIGVHLCLLSMEKFDKGVRLTLIDKSLGRAFHSSEKKLQKMEYSRRMRFLFRLTLWKPKQLKSIPNLNQFVSGVEIVAEKVTGIGFYPNTPAARLDKLLQGNTSDVFVIKPDPGVDRCDIQRNDNMSIESSEGENESNGVGAANAGKKRERENDNATNGKAKKQKKE